MVSQFRAPMIIMKQAIMLTGWSLKACLGVIFMKDNKKREIEWGYNVEKYFN